MVRSFCGDTVIGDGSAPLLAAPVASFHPVQPAASTLVRRAGLAHVLPFAQAPPAARLA